MPNEKQPLDPYKTMLVVRNKQGIKVGEIAACAVKAPAYIDGLAEFYEEMSVDYEYKELLKTVVSKFKCCVKRIGDKLYAWDDSESNLGDVPHDVETAVRGQVHLASIGTKAMKDLGEFTIPQLATKIHNDTGLPLAQSTEFADHLVQQFIGGMVSAVGDGKFKVIEEPSKTSADHMDDLRNILKNAGLGSDNV